jgi:hypothetical protein
MNDSSEKTRGLPKKTKVFEEARMTMKTFLVLARGVFKRMISDKSFTIY